MALMPPAEVHIDEELIRGLLQSQHPQLAASRIHSFREGWDNVVARVGNDLAVRLPRRAAAAQLILSEQRWLPEIAARVSVAVPSPTFGGVPSAEFPWAWSVVPWLPGVALADAAPRPLNVIARELASFIEEMHCVAPALAPHNAVRGVPLAARAHVVRQRLASGSVPRAAELSALWDRLSVGHEWNGEPLMLHGDLHPGNLLIDDSAGERRLSAVIDFGDLCAGDPASDLAVAWLAFGPGARSEFFAALPVRYRDDAQLRRRAHGWALVLATAFAAHSDDNPAMAAIGAHAITEVLR